MRAAVLVLLLSACGHPPDVKESTDVTVSLAERAVSGAHRAVNDARSAFLEWNAAAEATIVAAATSEADGKRMLAGFDQSRAPIVRAFVLAYTALAHAEALLPLIRAGKTSVDSLLPVLSRLAGPVSEINRRVAGLK